MASCTLSRDHDRFCISGQPSSTLKGGNPQRLLSRVRTDVCRIICMCGRRTHWGPSVRVSLIPQKMWETSLRGNTYCFVAISGIAVYRTFPLTWYKLTSWYWTGVGDGSRQAHSSILGFSKHFLFGVCSGALLPPSPTHIKISLEQWARTGKIQVFKRYCAPYPCIYRLVDIGYCRARTSALVNSMTGNTLEIAMVLAVILARMDGSNNWMDGIWSIHCSWCLEMRCKSICL